MVRGFLSGIILGGVVSVIGAGLVSVVAGDRAGPVADVTAPSGAAAPETGTAASTDRAKDADLVVNEAAPQVETPAPDSVTAAAEAGSDTPLVPETGQADSLAAPADSAETGAVVVDDDTPVAPPATGDAPDAPLAENDLSISTEPAQPAPPAVPEAPTAFTEENGTDAPDAPSAEAPAPKIADVTDAPPTIPAAPETTPQAKEIGQIAALPGADGPTPDTGPSIGTPGVSLVDRTPEVPDAAQEVAAAPGDARAIVAYAAPFENPDDKPLMSIVLMDSGVDLSGGPVGLAALQSFPYPLSFAVDASLSDATERMADYRAQGFEVLALIDLPRGATAGDAEVALSATLRAVPEAVAVMEGTGTGLQENRDASEQIAQAVQATGHGLVLASKGLNTAHKLAVRDGVPAGLVFRDFDSADQTPTTIRRFLDQAAFRAGQEGGVIMVGRVRPDTIAALLLWGLQDRAERVALAPISTVLTALVAAPQ